MQSEDIHLLGINISAIVQRKAQSDASFLLTSFNLILCQM